MGNNDHEAMQTGMRALLEEVHEKYADRAWVISDLLLSALESDDGRWVMWRGALDLAMNPTPLELAMVLGFAAAFARDWKRYEKHRDAIRNELKPRPAPVDPPPPIPSPRTGF